MPKVKFVNFVFSQAHVNILGTAIGSVHNGYRVMEWNKFRAGRFKGIDSAYQKNFELLYDKYKKGEVALDYDSEWIIEVDVD